MKSLHRGLTLWVWVTISVVGAVCVVIGTLQAQKETQSQLDYQMQQVAHILAGQSFAPAAGSATPTRPNMLPSIHIQHDKDDDLIVAVRDAAGQLLYVSRSNRQLPGGVLPQIDDLGFQTLKLGNEDYRVFAAKSGDRNIVVAQSMDVIHEAEAGVAMATLLPIGLLLPILAVVLGFAIRRQLKPLDGAAAAIANRPPLSLDLLPEQGMPAEVRPLVDEINRLLHRLSTAVEREQRFVTDAAHALRTPLTALQLQAEVLEGGSNSAEREARLAELRAGIRRVIRLSEQLLSLARSQSETGPITATTELDPTLEEVGAFYAASAAAKQIDLVVEAGSAARVYGNARRLTLIFGNLLDNSLRYTPAGGHIRIRASAAGGVARVEVWDEGCGLPPSELKRVFERFYRPPGSESSGSGLGLATVDALVQQLGGHVVLENRVDHVGLVAIVTLPLAPREEPPTEFASATAAQAGEGSSGLPGALLRTAVLAAFTLASGGCAIYHKQPLAAPDVEGILQSPDRTELSQKGTRLQHPLLKPIKLDFNAPLTGAEIQVIAVLANPDLRALRAQEGVADAQVFSAGLLPDPQVSLGWDKLLTPRNQGYTNQYAGSVSLDLLGALAGMPTEKQAAKAAARQLRDEIAWQEWATAGQAQLLALRLGYQARAKELAHRAADQADRALKRALTLAGTHDVAADEIELRRIAAVDARDKALTADRDADTTRLDLNQTLGLRPDEQLSLAPANPLPAWQHPAAEELFTNARSRRLDLTALAEGYNSQEASVHRAILGQYPRLGITINRASDTSNVHTLGPAVNFDLPLWNRNRGAIAVARADRTRLRAEYAARLHQTRAEIAALVASLDRDERARATLAVELPEIERVATAFEAAAQRHDVTAATAESARSAALDKEMALLALEQSCAEERVGLALAIGSPVSDFLESP
jgi:signal transduction histidine kinase/outer membrane protein TolC